MMLESPKTLWRLEPATAYEVSYWRYSGTQDTVTIGWHFPLVPAVS